MKNLSLRPYLPRDMPVLAAIFQDSIEELTVDDYDADQRIAWAGAADDQEAFSERLAELLTLVVEVEGVPAGFAALEDNDMIALLYVHPRYVHKGVATILCDALEKLAAARGTKRISTDASDTSQPFFAKRGYVATQRNTISYDEQWLGNTTMEKPLDPPARQGPSS